MNLHYIIRNILFLKFKFLSDDVTFLFYFIFSQSLNKGSSTLNNLFSIYTRPFSINFYLRIWVTDRRVSTPLLLRAALLIFLSVQCFLKMSSHDEISRNTRRQQRWPRSIPDICNFSPPPPPPSIGGACVLQRRIN